MTTLQMPTEDELKRRRSEALEEVGLEEVALLERAERLMLTTDEARALRRIREIDYLLGEDT